MRQNAFAVLGSLQRSCRLLSWILGKDWGTEGKVRGGKRKWREAREKEGRGSNPSRTKILATALF